MADLGTESSMSFGAKSRDGIDRSEVRYWHELVYPILRRRYMGTCLVTFVFLSHVCEQGDGPPLDDLDIQISKPPVCFGAEPTTMLATHVALAMFTFPVHSRGARATSVMTELLPHRQRSTLRSRASPMG
jgi:hypothetical protein